MKIVHISAANSSVGAGMACVKLHEALLNENVESKILFLTRQSAGCTNSSFYENTSLKKLKRKLLTFADRFLLKYYTRRKPEIFSPGLFGIDLSTNTDVQSADIIHLHWINHAFIDIKDLFKLNKPIVWTMHDCWTFTGGCHYFFSCDHFKKDCGKCQVLNSGKQNDLSNYIFKRKKKYYPKLNIKFLAISNWMKEQAKLGTLLKNESVDVIPSGIDCNVYNSTTSLDLREKLNLKIDDTIVLMGAQHLNSPFKGVQLSIDALNQYQDKKLKIITFGGGEIVLSNPLHQIINFGFVSNPKEMADLYTVADVFLCTSVAEGFGMTVAEAQCCGTPAIAFEETGPSDIINHKVTGYLAKFKNVDDVVNGLSYCLNTKFDRINIAIDSEKKFSIKNCAIKYKLIYKEILSEERKK
ncbi:glycosyltransferase [Solitalea lacus]|uniref:glycosyltransferase n=1 Tax=Solitalea lacus TaxID=2911172 RepID=UPI001EDA9A73|nr:glycosyltransferase [Solitalea lacus]UKJ08252.1 glycosyltransferase [Solitalea lacus]